MHPNMYFKFSYGNTKGVGIPNIPILPPLLTLITSKQHAKKHDKDEGYLR
jgi:hypothetical protein